MEWVVTASFINACDFAAEDHGQSMLASSYALTHQRRPHNTRASEKMD
jgi:hypothetical protein